MTKNEMIKILCRDFGYTRENLAEKTYSDIRKILTDERREERECSTDDDADLFPNGRDYDAEDEDYL